MVSPSTIRASNTKIASTLPAGLVGVFVGATSGIGEGTLKAFVKHTRQPRAYFVGRSQEAGTRIAAELKRLNHEGIYTFIKADVGLIKVVDDVCRQIASKEQTLNVLVQCQGTLVTKTKTVENLHIAASLALYSRLRFTTNLLPLLRNSTGIKRVISVLAGGYEGKVYVNDLQGWDVPMAQSRGHLAAQTTAVLECLAEQAPDVTFIHAFPGMVKNTGIGRGANSPVMLLMKGVFAVLGAFAGISADECGERQLFLATSAKFAPRATTGTAAAGVALPNGVTPAKGTDGKVGSNVYSVSDVAEDTGTKIQELMAQMRKDGTIEEIWKGALDEFQRITGDRERTRLSKETI